MADCGGRHKDTLCGSRDEGENNTILVLHHLQVTQCLENTVM